MMLAADVIELHAQKLKKIVVADELQIAPGEVTDSKLAELCVSIRDDPPDILVLSGCSRVTNLSCLMQLSTISHLDISSCYHLTLGAEGGFHLAGVIKDMGALTSLDVSSSGLTRGALKPNAWPSNRAGWGSEDDHYECNMTGITALAGAIKDMGELTALNLSSNYLNVAGAKIVAVAIKVTKCAIVVVLIPFSCPSDHWLSCCCLLLSTG
jgi:hypothetical protein